MINSKIKDLTCQRGRCEITGDHPGWRGPASTRCYYHTAACSSDNFVNQRGEVTSGLTAALSEIPTVRTEMNESESGDEM